jgi:NADPH:quinone reductase-like Zn-dependent oxidoreductase
MVRELPGKGVDVVLDGLGGALSLSLLSRATPGGRLVVFGHSATLVQDTELARMVRVVRGDRDRRALGLALAHRRVSAYGSRS